MIESGIVIIKSVFETDADFSNTRFRKPVDFLGTSFMDISDFRGARFSGDIDFRYVVFSGDTDFRGADFSGDASFLDANFDGDAIFNSTEFTKVSFSNTTFTNVSLYDADFKTMNVDWVSLQDVLLFDGIAYIKLIRNWLIEQGIQRYEKEEFNCTIISWPASSIHNINIKCYGCEMLGYANSKLHDKYYFVIEEDQHTNKTQIRNVYRWAYQTPSGYQQKPVCEEITMKGCGNGE
ncbi:MAG: pentapeptide repeat-containing protein [Candidatus Methanogasteraceae archaeon]